MTDKNDMKVTIRSFGYKYGVPGKTNLLCDVRFLANPYWVEELRQKSGKEVEVSKYVLDTNEAQIFLPSIVSLAALLIKSHMKAEKKELCIDIGCTGGRHRSVAVVEHLAVALQTFCKDLAVEHRDIDKDNYG